MPSFPLRLLAAVTLVIAGSAPGMGEDAVPGSKARNDATLAEVQPRARVVKFETEAQVDAFARQGRTVVFFFASWCPNCRTTIAELNRRWAEVDPGLTLVIADYDRETGLKARYGVTYQDTFVLLDSKGLPVRFWNGGGVEGLNANSAS